MEEYKLSIIIPVYNVEHYLRECMSSILNQPHEDCEIILVNDGSTDNSGSICDEYKESFIKVLHQENKGPSSARNAGVQIAQGQYVAFLDSDDRLASGSIHSITEWIDDSDADICFMEAVVFYPSGRTTSLGDCIEQNQIRGKTKEAVFEHLATRPKYPGSACTKLFRRAFLLENNLFFPDDRKIGEDLTYVLDSLLLAKRYDSLTFPYYEYRQEREGSATTVVNTETFWGIGTFVKETVEKTCEGRTPKNMIATHALSFASYEYSIILWQYSRLDSADRPKAKRFLKEYRWVMTYGRSRKLKMVKFLLSILGISMASKVLRLYMTHR
ncbi:MAG: glycosyltransferase family 2 protein [Clostridiaceae bacterium]|jgi:glycosyltransferase involved in cell wall biosynthesis|nr:glycosyltransferase family 2 protein [Clostridiaceae bacterium]